MTAKLSIQLQTVGPFAENTYLLGDPVSKEALLIDPGDEAQPLLKWLNESGLSVTRILNTHGHIDHVGAVQELREALGVPFGISEKDLFLLESIPQVSAFFGLSSPPIPQVDFYLKDGDTFSLGEYTLEVKEVPGHSPGHVFFYTEGHAFVGDCIFAGSIGRTDLPGGDHRTLLASIRNKIFSLPGDTTLYPGHGPSTTVDYERKNNPFFT